MSKNVRAINSSVQNGKAFVVIYSVTQLSKDCYNIMLARV